MGGPSVEKLKGLPYYCQTCGEPCTGKVFYSNDLCDHCGRHVKDERKEDDDRSGTQALPRSR